MRWLIEFILKIFKMLIRIFNAQNKLAVDITTNYVLQITGTTSATPTDGTMVFSASEDLTVTSTGDVTVSTARVDDDIYRRHTVTVSCPQNGTGTIVIAGKNKIVSLGNHGGASDPTVNFYTGANATAPILAWDLNEIPSVEKIRQASAYTIILPTTGNQALPTDLTFLHLNGANIAWTYTGALPTDLTYLYLIGANIAWTYTGALPTDLTSLLLNGHNIEWTYTGALPTDLTFLSLFGANIAWTYTGALPTNLTYLYLNGANIAWTYTGALPTDLTFLYLNKDNIAWTYTGALPTDLTYLSLIGANINWTGLDLGNAISPKNYTYFGIFDYATTSLTIAQLLTLLENIDTKTGNLPTITHVGDYSAVAPNTAEQIRDATANVSGTDAEKARYWINRILNNHGGTPASKTFQLNLTNITL